MICPCEMTIRPGEREATALRAARRETHTHPSPAAIPTVLCFGVELRSCVTNQARPSRRRQPDCTAVRCTVLQSIAAQFTPPSRGRSGREKQPSIGPQPPACARAWPVTGSPDTRCPTRAGSHLFANSSSPASSDGQSGCLVSSGSAVRFRRRAPHFRRGVFTAFFRCGESGGARTTHRHRRAENHSHGGPREIFPRLRKHRWGDAERFFHAERPDISKTERTCVHCGLVRVTRHESERHWVEFWRDGERVDNPRTPECISLS